MKIFAAFQDLELALMRSYINLLHLVLSWLITPSTGALPQKNGKIIQPEHPESDSASHHSQSAK